MAPIAFLGGRQSRLPGRFSSPSFFRLEQKSDFSVVLLRLSKVPKALKDLEDLLREGVKQGVTYAKESLGERIEKQVSE